MIIPPKIDNFAIVQKPNPMKKIFFLFLFLLPALVFSQATAKSADTINRVDANNVKYGFWSEKSNDQIVKGFYVNNKKTGVWVTTLSTNLIQRVENYVDGKKDGITLIIDRKGHLMSQEYYKNGVPHGLSISYSAYTEMPLNEINYLFGKKNGWYKTYYDNGKIQEESEFLEDIKNGVTRWYNKSGKRVAENHYVNGVFQGVQKTYYDNDSIMTTTNYTNNIMTGDYKEYYRNGKIKMEGKYVNGVREGAWIEFDELGKPQKTIKYKNGVAK